MKKRRLGQPLKKETLENLIGAVLNQVFFSDDGRDKKLYYDYQPGNSKLLIVTGENATGKSLFAQIFQQYCGRFVKRVRCVRDGLDIRTGPFASLRCGLIDNMSTGDVGVEQVLAMLEKRNKEDPLRLQDGETPYRGVYFVFDEPGLGLSENYQCTMGVYIGRYVKKMDPRVYGVVVVSHSRYLVNHLLEEGGFSLGKGGRRPHHVRFGDKMRLKTWLETEPKPAQIDDLISLRYRGITMMRKIATMRKRK